MGGGRAEKNFLLIILFIILFILYGFFPNFFERISIRVSSPLFALADSIEHAANVGFGIVSLSTKELLDNQGKLREDNESLSIENLFLQSQLRFSKTNLLNIENVVHSSVLVRPPKTRYDKVVLSRGSRDGVLKGARVYSANENLIGYITEVSAFYSIVELFSSPTSTFQISIKDYNLQASGTGGGGITALVPSDVEIGEGDVIYLQEREKHPIAKISRIDSNPLDPHKTVHAYLNSDIYTLSDVFVELVSEK